MKFTGRKTRVVFAGVLAFLLLAACGAFAAAQELKIGSNKVGSTWYVQAACIADVARATFPDVRIDAAPIAGGIGNLKLMGENKMNIALVMNNNAKWAYEGAVMFEKPIKNLRGLVGGLDQFYIGIAVKRGGGITSIEELAAKKPKLRVMTVQRGTTGEASAAQVFEACGFTYDDIKKWGGSVEHTDFEAITNAVKDGRCDIFIQSLSKGHPTFTELAVTGKIELLGMSKQSLDFLEKKYGYSQSTLPANSFRGQDKDLALSGYRTALMVTDKLDDDTAYKITRAVVEGKDALVRGHKAFEDFNPGMGQDAHNFGGVPLHPGAVKYYREKGLMK